jgi:hypothetical protein
VVSAALGALAALSRDAAAREAITADADWRAPWREGTLPAITAVMRWQIETAAAQVGGAPRRSLLGPCGWCMAGTAHHSGGRWAHFSHVCTATQLGCPLSDVR